LGVFGILGIGQFLSKEVFYMGKLKTWTWVKVKVKNFKFGLAEWKHAKPLVKNVYLVGD